MLSMRDLDEKEDEDDDENISDCDEFSQDNEKAAVLKPTFNRV